MNYLLDTNHWSYLQRNHPALVTRIRNLPDEATLYMPVVAQAELLVGVELILDSARRRQLRALYEQSVAQATEVLGISSSVAERYSRIFADLKRKGKPIETNDIWIAAIALAHGLTLLSSDADFRFVEGLKFEDWTQAETA